MTPEEKAAKEAEAKKKAEEKAAKEAEAKKKAEEKAAKEAEAKKKAEEKAAKEAAKMLKDKEAENLQKDTADYKKFAELHLAMCDEKGLEKKRIKESALENYEKLEKKFKDYKGKKPKKSANVFIGLGLGTRKIVEGYGVPQSVFNEFKDAGIEKAWFE